MVTKKAIRRAFLEEVFGGTSYKLATITGLTTTTVKVASLADNNISNTYWKSALMLRPDSSTALTTKVDLERRIQSIQADTTEARFIHTGLAYSDTTVGTEEVEIIKAPKNFGLADFDSLINLALAECQVEEEIPLTLLTNGAMTAALVTTGWTASASATIAYTTTEAEVWRNLRALKVTNAAANQYAESDAVIVQPGQRYYLTLVGRLVSGTGAPDVTIRVSEDGTTYADAAYQPTMWTSKGHVGLTYPFNTQTDENFIKIRLGATDNGDVTTWSRVQLLPANTRSLELPSTVVDQQWIRGVYSYNFHLRAGNVQHAYLASSAYRNPFGGQVAIHPSWATPGTIEFPQAISNRAVVLDVVRPAVVPDVNELSLETDEVDVPLHYVVPWVARKFRERIIDSAGNTDTAAFGIDVQKLELAARKAERRNLAYRPDQRRQSVAFPARVFGR